MGKRARISVIWLTAAFLLLGSAFSFAATGTKKHPTSHPTVSQNSGTNDDGNEVENDSNEPKDESPDTSTHERKLNHGFYVSTAAQCKDVDDPTTPASPDFTAPADCSGKARGEYVSSVAHSSLGKSNKGHHGKP